MLGEPAGSDPEATSPSGPFDIYETAEGPRHVENPVRRRILAMMRARERTVPEIIDLTGLGKSTVSAHLGQLAREGLVGYREDPGDRRCKLYFLTSRHVATAGPSRDRPELINPDEDTPIAADGRLSRLLLRTLLAELACSGLDLGPVVREAGRRVGEAAGRNQPARDLADWHRAAARFWREAGLGDLVFEDGDPARLTVDACALCAGGGTAQPRMCTIVAGLIEGMASESLGALVETRPLGGDQVHRSNAPAGRAPSCVFEVRVAAGPPIL